MRINEGTKLPKKLEIRGEQGVVQKPGKGQSAVMKVWGAFLRVEFKPIDQHIIFA